MSEVMPQHREVFCNQQFMGNTLMRPACPNPAFEVSG
jgi:hypothetical protein